MLKYNYKRNREPRGRLSMGVQGRRLRKNEEPVIYGTVEDILADAQAKGYIKDDCVDIESIITSQGILLLKEPMPTMKSGYLKKDHEKWKIVVNSEHHIKRQRFTMAHELAHYIYHRESGDSFEDEEIFFRDETSNSIEITANRFASDLLINPQILEKKISEGMTNIEDLASHFNVSSIAVKIQLTNMGYRLK